MNTGAEDEETLVFIDKCDKAFNLGLVWLECVVSKAKGTGTKYKIVTFETASRKGEPFLEVARKYGVPNQSYPHCNRELKLQPFESWLKDNYPGSKRAIGIRIDEIDRMSSYADALGIVYPLISWKPTTKQDVLKFWFEQPFNLNIPEHRGNCVTCWKKSDKKLFTLAAEDPTAFELFDKIEQDEEVKTANQVNNSGVFFRKRRSTQQMINEAADYSLKYSDPYFKLISDKDNGCSGSCDVFSDEQLSLFGYEELLKQ
jgi:hypothetical protein